MASQYRISIVRDNGSPVLLHPGASGERDFVADVVTRAMAGGVGMFRTEARVKAAIENALRDALYHLKSEVRGG